MPAESKTAVVTPPKSRPTTRSSIRHSLNLASMSKALADVITKDKDSTKNARKPKESSSRRYSALCSQPPPLTAVAAPRISMGEVRPPSQLTKRTGTPESRTITRRRVSGSYTRSSSEEQQRHPHKVMAHEPGTPQSSIHKTNSILRSKNVVNTTSALPKYRPKTNGNVNDPPGQKPPSPVKAGTRRRLSTSDEEKKEQPFAVPPVDKSSRPISPLPHRAALKTNFNSINVTSSPVTPTKPKTIASPSSGSKLSPVRPTKIVKTATTIPRPPSSTSSASSFQPSTTPRSTKIVTPTASEGKNKFAFSRSGNNVQKSPSRLVHSSSARNSPSPLSRRLDQSSNLTPNSSMVSGNMSHISEGACETEDSDLEDVELLLAPVAAIGAPTPAMPRIKASKKRGNPQTPSKSRLPSRENLSYVSPEPPGSDKRGSSLRPPVRPFNSDAPRGSILSWEQLAADASRTIGEDEFGRMLADVPAPFRSGAASPSLSSHLGLPDSPGLSIIDSPGGGYGSISQVLLPDVTPSPAVNHNVQQGKFRLTPDASKSAVESSTATLLRLQLASMESTAKERLKQIQAMEEEMHNIKQAHYQQMEEMQKQVHYMETQSRRNDERVSDMFKTSLEGQLRHQRVAQEEGFRRTILQFQDNAKLMHDRALDSEKAKMVAVSSASRAALKWDNVASICGAELEYVRADRTMLAFLLAQVDQTSMALSS